MRTRVGYAGGTKENPTYYSLDDHTETLEIDYDPDRISYAELLEIFWDSHYPIREAWSRQYMSIVFYHNPEQEALAREVKARREKASFVWLYTEIQPLEKFYLAEDYHQKYYLLNAPELLEDLQRYYGSIQELVDSTAAARVNGYIAGYGDAASLAKELESLGLSAASEDTLRSLARNP